MIYVLAYPSFAPQTAERINAFRARHEPERAKLVPPHITLVFGVSDTHLPTISALLDLVSGQTAAFPVTFINFLVEFDPFEKKHKLFLLCSDGKAQITRLHNWLYDGAHRLELSADHPFEPHMTIGSSEELADIEQIDVSAVGGLPIEANISALELVRLDGGCLTSLKTVSLMALNGFSA